MCCLAFRNITKVNVSIHLTTEGKRYDSNKHIIIMGVKFTPQNLFMKNVTYLCSSESDHLRVCSGPMMGGDSFILIPVPSSQLAKVRI